MNGNLLALARRLSGLGFRPVPPAQDGSKKPAAERIPDDCEHPACVELRESAARRGQAPYGWTHWQHTEPSDDQLVAWWTNGRTGIGFLTGHASGVGLLGDHGVEMLELEGRAVKAGLLDDLTRACVEWGLGPVLERLRAGWEETTPSGGIHWYYACTEVGPGQKLAKDIDGKDLIETRSEGQFTIIAPSGGKVHPSGLPWVLVAGGPETLPILSPLERHQLLAACCSLDRRAKPAVEVDPDAIDWSSVVFRAPPSSTESWMDALVEDYNRRTTWAPVLAGVFEWLFARGNVDYWHFVGAENIVGATTNANGSDRLIVFSGTAAGAGWNIYEGQPKCPSYDRFGAHVMIVTKREDVGSRVEVARQLRDEGYGPRPTSSDLISRATTSAHAPEGGEQPQPSRFITGGTFILDAPESIPAIWGADEHVLWAQGEGLIIAGPPGVGKTTLAGQVLFARLGLIDEVLGYPVVSTGGRVLYLASDRPEQIRRSFRRLATEEHREILDERLLVWRGPPPADLAKRPELLLALVDEAGADTVFLDSLKDMAIGISDDEVGAGLNNAIQRVLADDRDVAALHHQRKGQGGAKPKTLEDMYGSTWLAAGAGSIILLWGQAGEAIVELTHLKQPGAPVGPLKIEHDHHGGTTVVTRGFDPLAWLRGQPQGGTSKDAARAKYDRQEPTDNQCRGARRDLETLVRKGLALRHGGEKGGTDGTAPARYFTVETRFMSLIEEPEF